MHFICFLNITYFAFLKYPQYNFCLASLSQLVEYVHYIFVVVIFHLLLNMCWRLPLYFLSLQNTTFKTNYFLTNLHFAAKKHIFPSPLVPATKQNKKGISPRPWTALADVCACTCPYYAVTYKTNNLIIYSPTIIP